jgi:hypothetical protein
MKIKLVEEGLIFQVEQTIYVAITEPLYFYFFPSFNH